MTPFQAAILRVVQTIPVGQVASYGQVAAYIGAPRAARQVGWALRSMETAPDFPWWRVVNNAGRITIKGNQFTTARQQKELLIAEGIDVNDAYELNIRAHRFRPSIEQLSALKLDTEYVETVLAKYGTI